jgi:Ca2+-binding RTX toxin-like protein
MLTLGANIEQLDASQTGNTNLNVMGNVLDNTMTGNDAKNILFGLAGNDTLRGGLGNDTLNGGSGNDTFLFGRGDGQDSIRDNGGSHDTIAFDSGINPLDLVISRQANDLRLAIHGSADQITVKNWFVGTGNQTETIQAGNGQELLNMQVNQLINAMATFTAQNGGITWDQAIDQNPQGVQAVLAANGWQ